MKILFVFPRWRKLLEDYPSLRERLAGHEMGTVRMAGLGIPTAAASLPPGHEVTFVDEHVTPVDCDVDADLVGISFFTPQATAAYRIADAFRARGVPVVGGGIHPTMAPEDAAPHFDAIVRGPVEGLWPDLLEDLQAGRLRPVYAGRSDAPFAQPRRELLEGSPYLEAGIVQTSRGCPINCPFCVVPRCSGGEIYFRAVDDVVEDIRGMKQRCFFLADENVLFDDAIDTEYRRDLMNRLIAARVAKIFFAAAYPFMVRHFRPTDTALLHRAGCRQLYLVLGLHQPLSAELTDTRFREKVLELREQGIESLATFTLGNEDDPPEVEPLIREFCEATGTNLAEFTLQTPFPGTESFLRYEEEGRLLTRAWERYNGAQVVFRPRNQTPERLQERYVALWEQFYGGMTAFEVNQRYARGFGRDIFRGEKQGHGERA